MVLGKKCPHILCILSKICFGDQLKQLCQTFSEPLFCKNKSWTKEVLNPPQCLNPDSGPEVPNIKISIPLVISKILTNDNSCLTMGFWQLKSNLSWAPFPTASVCSFQLQRTSCWMVLCYDHGRFVPPGQGIQPIGGHGWWHLGHHDQKHSANGGVLTKTLDLKVSHKSCR